MYLLAFTCHLRPAEFLLLRVARTVLQQRGGPAGGFEQLGLLLSPEEESRSSKTGQYDESVLLDWKEQDERVWQRLNQHLDGTVRCPAPPKGVVSAGGLRLGDH